MTPKPPPLPPLNSLRPPMPRAAVQTLKEYPALRNAGTRFVQSSAEQGQGRVLEYWPAGEPGAPDYPRPNSLPLRQGGVELFGEVRPADIAGDVTSHSLIETNPVVRKTYEQFQRSMTPAQRRILFEQYQYSVANEGERRPFVQWAETSGMPSYFRGYLFGQWENAQQYYTPEQIKQFDELRQYLTARPNRNQLQATYRPR